MPSTTAATASRSSPAQLAGQVVATVLVLHTARA